MSKKAINAFVELGLKPKEAAVYAACLARPLGSFVHQISKENNIKRSTVDVVLAKLRKQGLVSSFKEGKRTLYVAEPPEKLIFSLSQRIDDFKLVLPTLMKCLQDTETPKVRFFEGLEGVRKIYEDIILSCSIRGGNEISTISSGPDLIRALPDHDKNFIRKRIRKRTPIRILTPRNPTSEAIFAPGQNTLRETRFFNGKSYPINGEINIFANKLCFVTLKPDRLSGAILEDNAIASDMRSIFNWLWSISAP